MVIVSFFNRKINNICGLTQETIIGLIANVESRELRRIEYRNRKLPPEHPRAKPGPGMCKCQRIMTNPLNQ